MAEKKVKDLSVLAKSSISLTNTKILIATTNGTRLVSIQTFIDYLKT